MINLYSGFMNKHHQQHLVMRLLQDVALLDGHSLIYSRQSYDLIYMRTGAVLECDSLPQGTWRQARLCVVIRCHIIRLQMRAWGGGNRITGLCILRCSGFPTINI